MSLKIEQNWCFCTSVVQFWDSSITTSYPSRSNSFLFHRKVHFELGKQAVISASDRTFSYIYSRPFLSHSLALNWIWVMRMIIHQVFGFCFLCYFSCFFFLHKSIRVISQYFQVTQHSSARGLSELQPASALPHCINVLTFPMLCVSSNNYSNNNNSTCIDSSSWTSDHFVVQIHIL